MKIQQKKRITARTTREHEEKKMMNLPSDGPGGRGKEKHTEMQKATKGFPWTWFRV
jgi:hypothetical protein